LGYVNQSGAGNPVHNLVYNTMTGNTTVLNTVLAANAINFVGSTGADAFIGYTHNDTLSGGAGNDTLSGGDGDDSIDGGASNDTLDGGNGIDTADYTSAASAVTVSLLLTTAQNTLGAGTDTLSGFENLTGSAFDDTLTGNNDVNVVN